MPPERELLLTIQELAAASGILPEQVTNLVHLGVVDAIAGDTPMFRVVTATRLRRMLRLRSDLGVNLVGAAIIVDLVDRLEQVQRELAPLRRSPS
jgi:hypothetical protein